jgi:peptidyl-prolyl cis-trans isomerase B (cyclophilin B)
MARQGQNSYSQGSQFFIVYEDTTLTADQAGGYTVVGQVTSGLDQLKAGITDAGTADGATDGAPAVPVTITAFTIE